MSPHAGSGPARIKAFLFDFGNVICRFDVSLFITRLAQLTGRNAEELRDEMRRSSAIVAAYETGSMTTDEFIATINERCGIAVPHADFVEAYTQIFTPIPTTSALIRRLKPQYRLGLVSNTSELHFEHAIRTAEVFPLFDTVTLSFRIGALKPAKAVYEDALRRLEVEARECVYIDDIEENVRGALALGMTALHYTDHTALVRSLLDLGVTLQ